ncbi:MAG: OmpH family outer membrane protein [Muribaculaceae bacterium]|nr:OmpH family outer membrane protein [Muribaculaceae bacterium]
MSEMPEIKEVQAALEASSKKYEDEFNVLREEFDKLYAELQKLDETTPQTIKDRRIAELQDKDTRIQQFRKTSMEDLQRQEMQLMAPIREKINQAIQAVGKEGGFTFLFEDTMPIYVGTDVTDVTSLVKAKLGMK